MPKNSDKLVLVTGATGHQGGASARRLRERGFAVRALSRHPDRPVARALSGMGIEVVRGDLNDPASLTPALEGAYGVYSVQTPTEEGVEAEVRQGFNLADAANRARIRHLVYSSVGSADRKTGIPHFESKFRIEEHIRSTGVPFTILRPVFFMENWLGMRDQIERGSISSPLHPGTRLQMIAADDIGAFVAMAFEHPEHWQGRAVDLAGDEISMEEVAQALSRLEGHEVRYIQVPWDEFEKRAGQEMALMYRWFEDVGYEANIPALRRERPNLMTFERWLHSKLQVA